MSLLVGALLTGAGLLGSSSSQRSTQRKQDQAIEDWLAYQERAKDVAREATDANRELNYAALDESLAGATEEARRDYIGSEADRLYEGSLIDAPELDLAPNNASYSEYLGRQLADATNSARELIKAQTKTKAYGGSSRDRGSTMRGSASDIGFNNMQSLQDLAVLQRKQSVEPIMYQHESTGLGELMATVGSSMFGTGLAGAFSGGAATGAGSTIGAGTTELGFGSLPPMGELFPNNIFWEI